MKNEDGAAQSWMLRPCVHRLYQLHQLLQRYFNCFDHSPLKLNSDLMTSRSVRSACVHVTWLSIEGRGRHWLRLCSDTGRLQYSTDRRQPQTDTSKMLSPEEIHLSLLTKKVAKLLLHFHSGANDCPLTRFAPILERREQNSRGFSQKLCSVN